jgi:hypothetical protein
MPEAEDIERANRTARAAGAVGAKAITPRYVAETIMPEETVLNFGAGKPDASGKYGHSETIRAAGGIVTEHDFGRNAATAAQNALAKKYDTVFASNVLNVQSGRKMLTETLEQIKGSAKKRAVFNFPESPRYSDLTAEDVAATIKDVFAAQPRKVGGTNRAPLWEVEITATAPRNAPNAKEAARRRMAARTQQERPERAFMPEGNDDAMADRMKDLYLDQGEPAVKKYLRTQDDQSVLRIAGILLSSTQGLETRAELVEGILDALDMESGEN